MKTVTHSRCTKCGEIKPAAEFSRDASRAIGLAPWCKDCYKRWRQADPDLRRERDRQSGLKYRQRLRDAVFDHYGHACACCETTERLTIDHINGDGATHRQEILGAAGLHGGQSPRFYAWLIRQNFPEGFQVLCRSCNRSKGGDDRCYLHQ